LPPNPRHARAWRFLFNRQLLLVLQGSTLYTVDMAKLKLDLHDIYNRGDQIDAELNRIVEEAIERRVELVEIIPGKGSGQLKKKVLRFLNQGHIKKLYHRVEKDDKNFGRIFIHFKF
jgi:hypothetical protein